MSPPASLFPSDFGGFFCVVQCFKDTPVHGQPQRGTHFYSDVQHREKNPSDAFRENYRSPDFQKCWALAIPTRVSWTTHALENHANTSCFLLSLPPILIIFAKGTEMQKNLVNYQGESLNGCTDMCKWTTFKLWLISPICLCALAGPALMHC